MIVAESLVASRDMLCLLVCMVAFAVLFFSTWMNFLEGGQLDPALGYRGGAGEASWDTSCDTPSEVQCETPSETSCEMSFFSLAGAVLVGVQTVPREGTSTCGAFLFLLGRPELINRLFSTNPDEGLV